ncbi:DUF305 domain-containing protein [Noviherbaspirillum aerium]|jgi:uncharacterized protein (DUF305 family)|uniref:DUF305 domain-containing protein n=1 Tax=Noviherbaspirillum aerium TaxID=2588497 RepID=UPI00124E057D|nr:DUF305 domain-containing protein [Noviherbaspirillum aerium]
MRITSLVTIAVTALAFSGPVASQQKDTQHSGMHGGQGSGAQMGHAGMQSSPGAEKAPFDLQFLDTMSAHHQMAIEMAQLAEKQASHDKLKQMAKKTIDDQQKEKSQMQEWKEQWYADKGDALNMKMPGMAESMKSMSMDKLQAARGDAFDALFIDSMSRHHQQAIKMAQHAAGKAQHKEVKDLAKKIIDEQKKEIAQLSKWKKEWKLAGK